MVRVEKNAVPVEKQAEQEYAEALATQAKAVQDYNVMMGIIEDPSEDEETEEA